MLRTKSCSFLLATILCLAPASAQSGFTNSLAMNWNKVWGSPYAVTTTSSESHFGYVDDVPVGTGLTWLQYWHTPAPLLPGRYAATVRIKKYLAPSSTWPLDLNAIVDGVPLSVTLPTSGQPMNQWVETPPLYFDVTPTTAPIQFTFENTALGQFKEGYLIDSFTIRPVPAVSSLATEWTHAWSAPYFTDNVPSPEALSGVVDTLNQVWWLEYDSPALSLPPGTYAAKVRVKKFTSAAFAENLDLRATVGATATQTTLLSTNQTVDQWVETPPVTFNIASLTDTVTFFFGNIDSNTLKADYLFDRLEIVPVSAHLVGLLPDRQASIGSTVTLDVFCPATPGLAAVCAFTLGTGPTPLGDGRAVPITIDAITNLSLTPGNGVFSDMVTALDGAGIASPKPTVTIPNIPALAGITAYAVAVTLDPAASLGIRGISTAAPFTFVP